MAKRQQPKGKPLIEVLGASFPDKADKKLAAEAAKAARRAAKAAALRKAFIEGKTATEASFLNLTLSSHELLEMLWEAWRGESR